jgi:hypothetical protein
MKLWREKVNYFLLVVNIFKCLLLIFIFNGVAFSKNPCEETVVKLGSSEKIALENNIKRQLRVENVNVISFFKYNNSSVAYIETYDADEVFVFYIDDEFKSDYITMWSGGAYVSERKDIEKWAKENVPGISSELAKCFSWYAIYREVD